MIEDLYRNDPEAERRWLEMSGQVRPDGLVVERDLEEITWPVYFRGTELVPSAERRRDQVQSP